MCLLGFAIYVLAPKASFILESMDTRWDSSCGCNFIIVADGDPARLICTEEEDT